MSQPTKEQARQRFIDHLAEKRLRLTSQREAIMDSVFSTTSHFTAEQLLAWARERDPSVSRATVYRSLPLLVEIGLLRVLDFGKDHQIYDPNYTAHPDHNHIICEDCGKIFEFENSRIEKLEKQVARDMGFTIHSKQLRITARCEQLRRSGFCPNKPQQPQ